jgi:hypothetical protein
MTIEELMRGKQPMLPGTALASLQYHNILDWEGLVDGLISI